MKIELDLEAFIDPEMETMDRITIEGVPPIDMVIKPVIPSVPATANALVNAIPHVINAEPGIMTPGDLPLVFALESDLRIFLKYLCATGQEARGATHLKAKKNARRRRFGK